MKDKDFEDIGKRLYDLEADPPSDGWKKISSVVTPPVQTGLVFGLRKHWWKPFAVALPILFYSVYKMNTGTDQNLTDVIVEVERPEALQQNPELSQNTNTKNDDNTEAENSGTKKSFAQGQNKKESSTKNNKTVSTAKESLRTDSESVNSESRSNQDNLSKMNGQLSLASIIEIGTIANTDRSKYGQDLIHNESINTKPEKTTLSITSEAGDDYYKEFQAKELSVIGSQSLKRGSKGFLEATDTAAVVITKEEIISAEEKEVATAIDQSADDEKKETSNKWRLSATFNPSYLTHPATPITDDDVYITDVEKSKPFKKSGYGLSVGVGKAITSNFYLDAHLSFTKSKQDISFLYATGNVDTLIAIEQPDKSVLVKPVYEIASGQIKSSYSYTGLRLGATYYFLSTRFSRFNIAAAAGVHYLLSSKLEENQNGVWTEIKNEKLDRMNYSLQLGAGYNLKISQSWELMINPTMTYYLNEVKLKNMPYNMNQRSLGINFMVSKKLGRKS